jgi:hypothetical protein
MLQELEDQDRAATARGDHQRSCSPTGWSCFSRFGSRCDRPFDASADPWAAG